MENKTIIREAVGIFDNYDQMENAISDLETSGFELRHISVLGSESMVKERFGESHVNAETLEDHPDAPRSRDVKKEELGIGQGMLIGGGMLTGVVAAIVASGGLVVPGAMVTTVIAAGAGGLGGTAVGALLAKLLGDKYGDFFQKQIDEGGLLLWVNTPDQKMEDKAQEILKKHGASDVHVHSLPVKT